MEQDDRRGWWRQVRDALRPETTMAPPSRRVVIVDAVLAIVLAVLAAWVAITHPIAEHVVFRAPSVPAPPRELIGTPEYPVMPVYASWPMAQLTALPLAFRHRYPLAVFWVVICAAMALRDGGTWITVLICVVATYSAVALSPYRMQALSSLVMVALVAGFFFRHANFILPSWIGPFVVLLVAGVLANLLRTWQLRLRAGQDRLVELQRNQEEATRRAVEEERSRIAGELHDVVTHNVSVMVIQAGAARKVMDAAPEQSKEALLAVEASGRAAMAELRHVMGLLAASDGARQDGSGDGLEPQPGLDQLDTLVERVRAAGIPVTVAVSSPSDPLPPGVDLAAYRVVQEALTNTIKHAVGAKATVAIGHDGDWLEIEIADTGGTPGVQSRTGNGRGLVGLRERLAVYGGTLDAGPRLGGGYRLRARMQWRTA
ncbi:sensor histidine kinase [Solihabitans fulvus]|uniref:sensor histidine kinase n=1 Tax=Solihabitans fulvus TaxID=1892852 RepID=UPI001CB75F61|nr:histidine kinase [Solihabitans fulvus]